MFSTLIDKTRQRAVHVDVQLAVYLPTHAAHDHGPCWSRGDKLERSTFVQLVTQISTDTTLELIPDCYFYNGHVANCLVATVVLDQ